MMKLYIRNVWVIKFLSIWIDLILSLAVIWDALVGQNIQTLYAFFSESNRIWPDSIQLSLDHFHSAEEGVYAERYKKYHLLLPHTASFV